MTFDLWAPKPLQRMGIKLLKVRMVPPPGEEVVTSSLGLVGMLHLPPSISRPIYPHLVSPTLFCSPLPSDSAPNHFSSLCPQETLSAKR